MGMKKSCSCGYWNQEQRECLYAGGDCIRDEKMNRVNIKVTEEWIEEKAIEVYNYLYYETFNLSQVTDFIRSLVEEIK